MKVRDFMISRVYTVKPTNSIRELLHVLNSNKIGGVPVVDDKDQLVGMISDGDVLRYLAPKPIGIARLVYMIEEEGQIEGILKEKLETPVREIMKRRNLLYVSPDEDFYETLRLISRHRFKKLPVVNGAGRVIGVLSRGDLIHNLTEKIISQ